MRLALKKNILVCWASTSPIFRSHKSTTIITIRSFCYQGKVWVSVLKTWKVSFEVMSHQPLHVLTVVPRWWAAYISPFGLMVVVTYRCRPYGGREIPGGPKAPGGDDHLFSRLLGNHGNNGMTPAFSWRLAEGGHSRYRFCRSNDLGDFVGWPSKKALSVKRRSCVVMMLRIRWGPKIGIASKKTLRILVKSAWKWYVWRYLTAWKESCCGSMYHE